MEKGEYVAIPDAEGDGSNEEQFREQKSSRVRTWIRYIFLATLVVLCCLAILTLASVFAGSLKIRSCSSPRLRLEWRSLVSKEKHDYIQATQCLQNTLSSLTGRGTLYDDFVYVHMSVGRRSHGAASFLPWHRAFLHIYETTLTEKCGYQGPMPYWAWELDWESLENSSIWDSIGGFGGDGDKNGGYTPENGRCVIDGPFKNTQRLYFDGQILPHCLGRGFLNYETKQQGTLFGGWISPSEMGFLERRDNYDDFRQVIELSIHNVMHSGINGEFASTTATNEAEHENELDPIFWLHHTQIDRLWWKWQQADPTTRFTEYQGDAFNISSEPARPARLNDKLTFMGMWEDIDVSDVMHTDGGQLCYRY